MTTIGVCIFRAAASVVALFVFLGGIMESERKIGVVKKIDNLGRVVVPKEMRDLYGFDKFVEVVQKEDGVLIRNPKYILVEKEK